MPECTSRRHLHGLELRSRGRKDVAANITTPCAGCHRLVHLEIVQIEGAPGRLIVRIGRLPDGTWRETWRGGARVA